MKPKKPDWWKHSCGVTSAAELLERIERIADPVLRRAVGNIVWWDCCAESSDTDHPGFHRYMDEWTLEDNPDQMAVRRELLRIGYPPGWAKHKTSFRFGLHQNWSARQARERKGLDFNGRVAHKATRRIGGSWGIPIGDGEQWQEVAI